MENVQPQEAWYWQLRPLLFVVFLTIFILSCVYFLTLLTPSQAVTTKVEVSKETTHELKKIKDTVGIINKKLDIIQDSLKPRLEVSKTTTVSRKNNHSRATVKGARVRKHSKKPKRKEKRPTKIKVEPYPYLPAVPSPRAVQQTPTSYTHIHHIVLRGHIRRTVTTTIITQPCGQKGLFKK
jgi:hypothetical protein